MLYLPIFEAIETEERPYIILREITNILEGFIHLQTCRRLGFNLIKLPQSNLLVVAEGESEARFNNKCCVSCWLVHLNNLELRNVSSFFNNTL